MGRGEARGRGALGNRIQARLGGAFRRGGLKADGARTVTVAFRVRRDRSSLVLFRGRYGPDRRRNPGYRVRGGDEDGVQGEGADARRLALTGSLCYIRPGYVRRRCPFLARPSEAR